MFEKTARGHTYLYLVENEREGGHIRQRIIRPLGRKDVLMATGELDRLVASLVRHCDRALIPGRRRGRLVWGVGCQDAHCVFFRCRISVLAKARCWTIRGELAIGRERSRYTLVFGRSAWTSTMMQSCASAAKLRDGRPIL